MGKPKLYSIPWNGTPPIQGFIANPSLTTTISDVAALDVADYTAIRVCSTDITYQLNGVGPQITAPAGQAILIHDEVTSIAFISLTDTTCEVME